MRTKYALTLIAAATVSFAASAAPADTSAVASAPAASVHVVASTDHYQPVDWEAESVKGVYTLADGRKLHVLGTDSRLYAEVGGQKTEIVPVAPHVYASRDDGLRLEFSDRNLAYDVKVSAAAR